MLLLARVTVVVGCALAIAAPARAQPCHVSPESAAASPRAAGALLEAESAPAALHAGRPGFEALGVRLIGTFDRVAGFVAARGYRVSDGAEHRYGIGDLLAGASVRVFGSAAAGSAGLALSAWFPTAEAGSGLGAGHVMLMPSLWADRRWSRVFVRAAAGYGRALASAATHAGHVHGAAVAVVDPMNRSELAASATVEIPVFARWAARAALLGALAVHDDTGRNRALAGLDWRYQAAGYAFAATARLPLHGHDFGLRLGAIAEISWGRL